MNHRTEEDSLGLVNVPANAYYGSFTERARSNFRLTDSMVDMGLIKSIAKVKIAAARVNMDIGSLEEEKGEKIEKAAVEIVKGKLDDAFVLDELQAGAGTATHMNVNEVIANRATEMLGGEKGEYRVHPNDDVNMGQSSNNVVPTALRLASLDMLDTVHHEVSLLCEKLIAKGEAYQDVVKVGRTHLQDAVPVTVGQEMDAYAASLKKNLERINDAADELLVVGLGGNAIGTGINTPESFSERVVDELSSVTGYDVVSTDDPIQITQSMTPFERLSDSLKQFASDGIKLADDLMLLASGPNAGIGEIDLPDVEPGSSIMPGKVNPSIAEAFKMCLIQVKANADAVSRASEHGDLEMNVMAPIIGKNVFEGLRLVANAVRMIRTKCIEGMKVNKDRVGELFDKSTVTATALSPYLGYSKTAEIVHAALDMDKSIPEIVRKRGLMTEDEINTLLEPERLTGSSKLDEEIKKAVQERIGDTDG